MKKLLNLEFIRLNGLIFNFKIFCLLNIILFTLFACKRKPLAMTNDLKELLYLNFEKYNIDTLGFYECLNKALISNSVDNIHFLFSKKARLNWYGDYLLEDIKLHSAKDEDKLILIYQYVLLNLRESLGIGFEDFLPSAFNAVGVTDSSKNTRYISLFYNLSYNQLPHSTMSVRGGSPFSPYKKLLTCSIDSMGFLNAKFPNFENKNDTILLSLSLFMISNGKFYDYPFKYSFVKGTY